DAGLDAANVDVKGCEPQIRKICGIALQPVLDNVVHMIERGVNVELTTLVVPRLSDDMDCLETLARWILDNAGSKTPWHLNRYYPAYEYTEPATSLELLIQGRDLARKEGLEFVYIGNVGKKGLEDTFCPECGTLCYERHRLASRNMTTDANGNCSECGFELGIRFLD
ncbi:MAG: radical SAM protein, partial [Candidatus Thorarchaeota archaeon]